MSHLLLIGAGFSRNWGGWLATEAFEYLLGCQEVMQSAQLQGLLWKHQAQGGFESALAELQQKYVLNPQESLAALLDLNAAVERMFRDMNRGLLQAALNFTNDREKSIGAFLARFDAIFTLNQDVLLEQHYMTPPNNVTLLSERQPRWQGAYLPGMSRVRSPDPAIAESWSQSIWQPKGQADFVLETQSQPVFKLHGSSNWQNPDGRSMLIMGGAKVREINLTPILSWYATKFDELLHEPGAKLMVIGYGFRDSHINDEIKHAVERGLKLFIIAPEGAELAQRLNPTNVAPIKVKTELEDMMERSLIGASRRPLSSTFGNDNAEFEKVIRFFA